MFDYYTLSDSKQISFYQLPRELVKHERFKILSDSAKILYALLRDRVSLSIKNNWIDEKERVYIIFTLDEIMENLGCANQKATKAMQELQKIGLIESVRQGLGKPNIIYVKNFASIDGNDKVLQNDHKNKRPPENHANSQIHDFHDSGIMKIMNQESLKSGFLIHENHDQSILIHNKTEWNQTEWESCPRQTRSQKLSTQLSTELSTIKKPKKTDMTTDVTLTADDYSTYEQLIKNNVNYTELSKVSPLDKDLIDGILAIILDVITTQSPNTLKIGKETKSRDIVRSIYLKLNKDHIQHIIHQYKKQHHRIKHKDAYLRKMLFTCAQEIDAHYINAVRADGMVH